MNTIILTKYNIKFEFLDEFKEGIVKQTSVDDLSYALSAFLMENAYVDYLENEILNEINDVMGNLPIDILERGEETVLLVGNPLSTFVFYGRSSKTIFIPTTDLKEIILSWIEFLKNNNIFK